MDRHSHIVAGTPGEDGLPAGVRGIQRIIPDIGVEVDLILISNGIDLEEASMGKARPR
jgi:hypothetical protein